VSHPFNKLHHVCLVVDDLGKAVAYFESLGVTGWQDFPPLSDFTEVSLSREDFQTLAYKYVNLDGIQLQLCHPAPGATPQRRYLESHGPGVYHLGFGVADVDAAEQDGLARDLEIRGRGRRADGTGFTYFETEAGLGVTLEVRSPDRL
jgi:catechol 2,3-dioxygenase-like lactoylglutathione lyase family enzyme